MKISTSILRKAVALAFLGSVGSAYAALPAVIAPCSVTDITVNAQDCRGFYGDQWLSGNPGDIAVQIEALGELGFTWDGATTVVPDNRSGLNGATLINFAVPLQGITYIGLHFGGGEDSPVKGQDTTAFYRLDAGAGLGSLTLNWAASSDIKVYSTTVTAVPEPETYALMLAGLGVIGFVARRRNKHAA